jgi:hypothetical protein
MSITGPVTPGGKAIANRNAVRHGLYTDVTVATREEGDDAWLAFHDATVESLSPEGALEAALASRIAALAWRLRRIPAAEADVADRTLAYHRSFFEVTEEEWKELDAMPFYTQPSHEPPPKFPSEKKLAGIMRVEAHINRQLMHTLHELEALQDRRQGNRPALARVDVQGLPGT